MHGVGLASEGVVLLWWLRDCAARWRLKTNDKVEPLKYLLPMLVLLSACESKWDKMPDDVLAAKYSECLNMNDPAAAMIQVCKNYKRECEKRRERGIYAC